MNSKLSKLLMFFGMTFTLWASPVTTAKKYLGTKYYYGASTKTTKNFDCSSFVERVYKSKKLPRTTREQIKKGKRISKAKAKPGDLIFFSTKSKPNTVGHVGIYLGNKKFIHASSAKGKVVISSITTKYYKKHLIGWRRL